MKLDTVKFGLASAGAFAILWLVCSLIVWLMPSMMMAVSGHMVHADLSQMGWHLTIGGVLAGLVGWAVSAGVTAMLIAKIYNQLISNTQSV